MTEKKSPFRYLNSINNGKEVELESDYSQFLVNRGLSMYLDTVLLVNELNLNREINDQMHYRFLLDVVAPKKRFGAKWPKPAKHSDASAVSAYYQISMRKAYEYLPLISAEQLSEIKAAISEVEDSDE